MAMSTSMSYYHCTKKSKLKCPEPCIRQEELDRQLSLLIQKFSLRPDWAAELNTMLEKEKTEAAQSSTAFVQESQERIRAIQTKLQRLLDGYLEQDIEREIYRTEKAKLLSEKKSLEEQMARIEQKRTGWHEPRLGGQKGARQRAEKHCIPPTKSVGGALRRQRKSRSIFRKSDFGDPTGNRTRIPTLKAWCPNH